MGHTAAWQGGEQGLPKFGKKARAWLARQLRAKLREIHHESWHDEEGIARLVDWHLERWDRFVRWVDADEFRGSSYAYGAWQIAWDAVKSAVDEACADNNAIIGREHRESDARLFPTLEDWLRADIASELSYAGAGGGMDLVRRHAVPQPKARRAPPIHSDLRCPCGKIFAGVAQAKFCPLCREKRKRHHAAMLSNRAKGERGVFLRIIGATRHLSAYTSQEALALEWRCESKDYKAMLRKAWRTLDRVDPPTTAHQGGARGVG